MYSREQIDKVRSSVDLVEVIRTYVPSLKAAGRSVRGLCPFHTEKTPSFHVQPEKGLFKCFGCGEAGDVIAFVSKLEQTTFSETLEKLASQAGITLQKTNQPVRKEEESLRDKLFRVLESALKIYEDQLWENRVGETARKYLDSRGVTEDTAQDFRLGYAAPSGVSAFEKLIKKGFPIDLCQKAGLVSRSSSGRYFDPLFGRLIFPIFDHFGHVVGFGGRVLPQSKKAILNWGDEKQDEGPKYLNSPESPVFSKGKLLYGLHQAKSQILQQRRVVVLEGYMDVIGAHQGGFPLAVATLGTAFTRDHAKSIKRYADEVVACFDPDEAGQRAAMKGLEPLLQENLFPRVVITEGNLDPDEIILKEGPDAFGKLIDNAPDFVDYILKTSSVTTGASLQERSKLAQQLLTVLSNSTNEILKSEWIGRISNHLGVRPESLQAELQKKKPMVQPSVAPSPMRRMPKPQSTSLRVPTAEDEFLQLLFNCKETWNGIGLTLDDLTEEKYKVVFSMIQQQLANDGQLSLPAIHDALPENLKEWFLNLSLEQKQFSDPLDMRDQLIRDIRIKKAKKRFTLLGERMRIGTATPQEQAEYKDLQKKVKGSARAMLT